MGEGRWLLPRVARGTVGGVCACGALALALRCSGDCGRGKWEWGAGSHPALFGRLFENVLGVRQPDGEEVDAGDVAPPVVDRLLQHRLHAGDLDAQPLPAGGDRVEGLAHHHRLAVWAEQGVNERQEGR